VTEGVSTAAEDAAARRERAKRRHEIEMSVHEIEMSVQVQSAVVLQRAATQYDVVYYESIVRE